ncbi:MAG TPA: cation:proton antiporter, partial [Candidatus Bathyarchaeia archaeon]
MASELEILRQVVGLSLLVFVAKVLGGILSRFKYPGVAGEVLAGMIFGPLTLGGAIQVFVGPLVEFSDLLLAMAQIGGIIVLFAAGLKFTIADLKASGFPALVVASLGVVIPLTLGYIVPIYLGFPPAVAILIGATLTATSIAVTVRTLEELRQLHSVEARLLVNAAVIDDVLGLAVLAVVTSVFLQGQAPDVFLIMRTVGVLLGLWLGLLAASVYLLPRAMDATSKWQTEGTVEAASTASCFGVAAVAYTLGLSPFVGAFSAGMAVANSKAIEKVKDYTEKLLYIFGTLFFAVIGARIDPRAFLNISYFLVVVVLLVAVASKIIGCGIPAAFFLKDPDKGLRVGVGMASRGEVGL